MKKTTRDTSVQEALALLYEMTGDVDRAILSYLDGSLANVENAPVFEWVEKYEKIDLVADKALVLFRLSSKQAAALLGNHMEHVSVGVGVGRDA